MEQCRIVSTSYIRESTRGRNATVAEFYGQGDWQVQMAVRMQYSQAKGRGEAKLPGGPVEL